MKAPIICGREPTASAEERKLVSERSAELSAKVNQASLPCWRSLSVLHSDWHAMLFYSIKAICYILYPFLCLLETSLIVWWFLYDIQFILRRTNALLSNHLPPKVCLFVWSNSFSCSVLWKFNKYAHHAFDWKQNCIMPYLFC